jgi:succinate-semialdehyde dehydrogenase/glutarate-semialdehyde dehydrogenase
MIAASEPTKACREGVAHMTAYPQLHMLLDGERVFGGGREVRLIRNPATDDPIGELPLATAADLDRALASAQRGFRIWRETPAEQRAQVLAGAARLLIERKETLAAIATMEEGKPLSETRIEVMMVANLFNFYAGECQRLFGRAMVRPTGQRSTVAYEPVGPVAAFAPWNFPIGNPGRKLGAPIAVGCSVILKAAEETPASALGVLQALYDAGLPTAVAQAVFGVPDQVSRHLLRSGVVRKLSFTGSTIVGKQLMKLAADNCIRTTMELGGHGPVLIFDDVDVETVLGVLVASKFRNAGQVCVSPTRFIVHEKVFKAFRDGFIERARNWKVGNGLDDGVQMGPLAHPRRLEAMDAMIGEAVTAGSRLDCGGRRIGGRGYFFTPTVLSDVPLSTRIMNEEPFGPVALINSYSSEEAMIEEANRLPYGLAAYLWTNDAVRQRRVARAVEVGMLGINTATLVRPDTPFGGVKWSGHGHEDGVEGLHACLVTKVVHEG